MDSFNTCCLTGHRLRTLGFEEDDGMCEKLKKSLHDEMLRLILYQNVRHFITGGALGFDTFAAEAVLQFRAQIPEITLEIAVPCRTQPNHWSADNRKRYQEILAMANKVTVLSEEYTPWCMHQRNQYMVDQSQFVLAFWNGSQSGTGNTVSYALKKSKNVICAPIV